eukprot:gene9167-18998_t
MNNEMEDCFLEESSFEILSRQLVRSSFVKENRDKKTTYNNIIKRQESLNKFVYKKIPSQQICGDCLADLSDIIDLNISQLEKDIHAYEIAKRNLSKELNYVTSHSAKKHESIESEIEVLNKEFDKLKILSQDLDSELYDMLLNTTEIDNEISDELKQINQINYFLSQNMEDLNSNIFLHNNMQYEIQLLSQHNSFPLFNFKTSSSCTIYPISYSIQDNINNLFEINGFRISFLPIPSKNLNWIEINAAWSCLSLALKATFNICNISENQCSFFIRPLRRRCFLIRSHTAANASLSLLSFDNSTILCLEGGKNEILSPENSHSYPHLNSNSSTSGFLDEYTRAVIALAAVVLEMTHILKGNNTDEFLKRFPQLMELDEIVTNGFVCSYDKQFMILLCPQIVLAVWGLMIRI